MRSTIICLFLTSLFSIPLYCNADFVLSIWLVSTPEYALSFTQLVLINCMIDSIADCTIAPALATGKIRKFYIITGGLYIITLPIAYLCLKFGCDATSTMFVSIFISVLALIARVFLLKELINFPVMNYFLLVGKLAIGTFIIGSITLMVTRVIQNGWSCLVISTVVAIFLLCLIYTFIICTKQERQVLLQMVKTRLYRQKS